MTDKIYCSTGCLIGRANGYDYRLIAEYAPRLDVSGLELMMLKAYYEHFTEMVRLFSARGLYFPVLHTDKEIGDLISLSGSDDLAKAFSLFDSCCSLAGDIGAKKVVLHLWGGRASDTRFENNLSAFETILGLAGKRGLAVAVENIPCVSLDPLAHWRELEKVYGERVSFIFDTRFGAFHRQLDEFLDSDLIELGKVIHMHVSDFTGPPLDFTTLRPILHPGEGIIDFEGLFDALRPRYSGSVTLESPVLAADGSVDFGKLNSTLGYIKRKMK